MIGKNLKQLIADGVDGIITDFPDQLIDVTNQLGMQTLKVEDAHR